MSDQAQGPIHIGVVLFQGFQALDAFGPLDILNVLSWSQPLKISLLSDTLDPVTTQSPQFPGATGQLIQPTHTFAEPPADVNVLLIPGGYGTRNIPATDPAVCFIREKYPSLRYLLTVCTGTLLAARAGILDGRKATTNKKAFRDVAAGHPSVDWVGRARFVVDGNVWTASGVSAGMDLTLAWIAEVFGGVQVAEELAKFIEYEWVRKDGTEDPFADVYGL